MNDHDIVSTLYLTRELINSHLAWTKSTVEDDVAEREGRHIQVLEKAYLGIARSLDLSKRFGDLSHELPPEKEIAHVGSAWARVRECLENERALLHVEVLERIPDMFPCISCRREDLETIFYQIAKNGAQAMANGKLVIRAQVGLSAQEELFAFLTIADSGEGIPKEKLRLVFDPFYTTKPLEKGNGLGLWIVRKLVRRNRGNISIKTGRGFGTEFCLAFPLAGEVRLEVA